MDRFSAYEYLSYVLPGGSVLFFAVYGWSGWPRSEPGAGGLVGMVAAAFVVGNAVAALATWFEPLVWGRWPGTRPDSTWGLYGPHGYYETGQRPAIEAELQGKIGIDESGQRLYSLVYSRLLQDDKQRERFQTLNGQIGFYRGMLFAAVVCFVINGAYAIGGHQQLGPAVWLPLAGAAIVLFGFRYRHFWVRFGDYIVRGGRLLPGPPV